MGKRRKVYDVDEFEIDYAIENRGRTHMLIFEFPVGTDEESFLISLKDYLKAQSEHLRCKDDKAHQN